MNYESVEQAVAALKHHQEVMAAYNHALGVLYLDATTAAPSDTWEGRGRTMEIMSEITYKLSTDPEIGELLTYLEAHTDELDPDGLVHVRVDYKVSGIGSNSCGPMLAEPYRLAEEQVFFEFDIE